MTDGSTRKGLPVWVRASGWLATLPILTDRWVEGAGSQARHAAPDAMQETDASNSGNNGEAESGHERETEKGILKPVVDWE